MLAAQFDRFAGSATGIITTYVHAEECRLVRGARRGSAGPVSDRAKTRFELCVYTSRPDGRRSAHGRSASTTEFLATYVRPGGVHSRGTTMGLRSRRRRDRRAPAVRPRPGSSDLCIRFVGDDQLAQLERFTAEVLPHIQGEHR